MRKIVFAALLVALALAGCGDDETEAPAGGDGGGSTPLSLQDNTFEPAVVEGDAGGTVTLSLENTGQAEHTFTVDDQKIDEEVEPGAKATVDVTIPDSGTIKFYCRYHEAGGMVGTLKVSGSGGGSGSGEDSDQEKGKGSYY